MENNLLLDFWQFITNWPTCCLLRFQFRAKVCKFCMFCKTHHNLIKQKTTQLVLFSILLHQTLFLKNNYLCNSSEYSLITEIWHLKKYFFYLFYQIWQPHTDKWAEDLQFSSFLLTFEILVQLFCFFMALVPLRWNRDSGNPAHALLEKLFQDGTIEGTTQPKTVYDAHEIFKQYS